jgi:hypothetical protein
LHSHSAIFCSTVWSVQPVQTSKQIASGPWHGMRLTSIQYFEATPGSKLNSGQRLLCGGLAGITSVTFTYPLDIVRTRLSIQSASFKELGHKAGQKLPGMFELMITMYKTEGGWTALYRGIVPTVAGVAPYVSSHS